MNYTFFTNITEVQLTNKSLKYVSKCRFKINLLLYHFCQYNGTALTSTFHSLIYLFILSFKNAESNYYLFFFSLHICNILSTDETSEEIGAAVMKKEKTTEDLEK